MRYPCGPQVPDAAERAGFTSDDLVRLTVTALVDEAPNGGGGRADRQRDRQNAGSGPRHLPAVLPARVLGDWTSSISPPTQGAADILLNAPIDNSWLASTAATLSFDVRDADPQLARKLAARAMTAAEVGSAPTGSCLRARLWRG